MKNAFGDAALTRGYRLSESVAPSFRGQPAIGQALQQAHPFGVVDRLQVPHYANPHSTLCLEYHLCLPAKFHLLYWDAHLSSDRNQYIGFYSSRVICLCQFSLEVKNCLPNIQTPLSLILPFHKVIPEKFTKQSRNF